MAESILSKKRSSVFKKSPGDIAFYIIDITIFVIFTLICLFPFYYLLINTISDNNLVSKGLIILYPKGINIKNYLALKNVSDLGNAFLVTVLRTLIGTALMVLVSAYAGYLVTKEQMWKRKFCYRFIIITMYFNAGLIPWYLNMLMLGLTNTFAAYILPGLISPFNIILVKTYIESIPKDIEESAMLDGAGPMRIFITMICPLSTPVLATIAVFGAVANWNSFQDSLVLMQGTPELFTLQHRLYVYLSSATNLEALMRNGTVSAEVQASLTLRIVQYTISMVSILPILCVYPLMQRYFVKGIMMGAVKG